MKSRRVIFTPQARQDMRDIVARYRQTMGASVAAKVTRSLAAGVRATARISSEAATRRDFPEGYFRVIAKAHLVIFQIKNDTSRIVRIIHAARDPFIALQEIEAEDGI